MSLRALCIEPSASMRGVLGEVLRAASWEVILCADLSEVTPVMLRRGVNLLLTAAQLPGGDYGDVLQRFRDGAVSGDFPIILLTGDTDAKSVTTALVKGVTEVFCKNNMGALKVYLETLSTAENGSLKGLRALVLDDDVTMGLYLGQILGEMGMIVDRHVSLDHALAATVAKTYDLIIADIVLGNGDSGNHFIRLLRQSSTAGGAVPVIAVSGYSDRTRRLDALRAGANVYLTKPVEEEEFLLTIRRLLGEEAVPTNAFALAEDQRLSELSKREMAICRLVTSGLSDKRIADQLGISYWTVRTHLASTFRKCGVMNRVELAHLLRQAEGRASEEVDTAMLDGMGLAQAVVGNFQNAVIVTDSERRILYVNPAFSRITGYEAAAALGKTPSFLSSGKHSLEFYHDMLGQLKDSGSWSGEIWDRHQNGELFLAWLDIRRLPPGVPLDACYMAVMADVTERHLEFDQIRHYALHDALTGLGNRSLLESRWLYETARARRSDGQIGILFLDLDRFKQINDSLGHEIGDQLLSITAARIRSCVRDNDTVIRYGGDEFVILLPDFAGREAILHFAVKLLEVLNVPIEQAGIDCRVGASIGISVFPEDGNDLEALVSRADAAMYRAKEAGGNVAHFFAEAEQRDAYVRSDFTASLDRDELELCFQPRINLASLRLVGAGTLLRWNDPARRDPVVLKLGERNNHIIDLFDWMLQQACVSLRRLQEKQNGPFELALKVPAVQLLRRNFVSEVAAALARNGVAGQCLQLEIAEAAWLREPEQMREVLGSLREMKVSLALDGFGSSHSCLALLKDAPFDTLKLDPDLIRILPSDSCSATITSAVLQLASDLGLKVLADGVDSQGLLARLKTMACHLAQGALFGELLSETQLRQQLAGDPFVSTLLSSP